WRGDYVHKGKAPFLSADVERYVQLLFLDLLRHELDLPQRRYAAAMQKAVGVDLSPIGLADNRTDEQKRILAEAMAAASPAWPAVTSPGIPGSESPTE